MLTLEVTATEFEQAARVKASAALVFAECTAANHDNVDMCLGYLETLVNADHAFDLLFLRVTSEAFRKRGGPASHLARTLDRVSTLARAVPTEQALAFDQLADAALSIAFANGMPEQQQTALRGRSLAHAFRVFREALDGIA